MLKQYLDIVSVFRDITKKKRCLGQREELHLYRLCISVYSNVSICAYVRYLLSLIAVVLLHRTLVAHILTHP